MGVRLIHGGFELILDFQRKVWNRGERIRAGERGEIERRGGREK